MKRLTNQGKAVLFTAFAVILYTIPMAVLLYLKRDDIFKNTQNALSIFSVIIIVFMLIFLKKVVKNLCKIMTPIGFGSALLLIVSLVMKSFLNDLFLISCASCVGSALSWYFLQLSSVYIKYSKDSNGDVIKTVGMSFKQANDKLFAISLVSEDK